MLFVRVRNVSKPVEAPRKVSIRSASAPQAVETGESESSGKASKKG
jgi:hypothetical protein